MAEFKNDRRHDNQDGEAMAFEWPNLELPDGFEHGQWHLRPVSQPEGLLFARPWQLASKRLFDIVGSTLLLVALSAPLLITALVVFFASRGPALYVQERVGLKGRRFKMLKFRTMHFEAHHARADHVDLNESVGPVFKIREDPRLTRNGRLLRRSSIDELPQLFNVLIGQMSLVGPRPPIPEEVATYGPRESQRLLVKPGLTCIWQVSGRADVDFDSWIDMDLEYIRTWSLWLDLKLLVRTIPAVLTRRGAY